MPPLLSNNIQITLVHQLHFYHHDENMFENTSAIRFCIIKYFNKFLSFKLTYYFGPVHVDCNELKKINLAPFYFNILEVM